MDALNPGTHLFRGGRRRPENAPFREHQRGYCRFCAAPKAAHTKFSVKTPALRPNQGRNRRAR